MAKIISIHSFRRGTGKTNVAVSLAALLAKRGWRVGLVDSDLASPSAHVPLGVDLDETPVFLNDFLMGRETYIDAALLDVTEKIGPEVKGELYLIPSSPNPLDISHALRDSFNYERLKHGYHQLADFRKVDILLIDTHAGITEQSLVSLAASNMVAIILRLDQQDYQGTAVLIDLVRKLGVAEIVMIVNEFTAKYDPAQVKKRVEETYGIKVVGIIPHSEDLIALSSGDVFTLRHPDHPLTDIFGLIADEMTMDQAEWHERE